jgi:hypothetical protein
MGNRIFYGNYVDGYDVVNSDGDQINIDYNVNGVSETIEPENLSVLEIPGIDYSIDPLSVISVDNSKIQIDLSDAELIENSTIAIFFNLIHDSFSGSSLYPSGAPINDFDSTFYFTLPRTYSSVY